MGIYIVQLGSARLPDEGVRIGTVRRPPRGVPKAEFAAGNYYDVWLPNLSPSPELMAEGRAATNSTEWKRFVRLFRAEMNNGETGKVLDLLAVLSKTTNFSIGCYCDDESHCHRSVLRELLEQRGADFK